MIEKRLSDSCWNLWVSIAWSWFGIFIVLGFASWVITLAVGEILHGLLLIPIGILLSGILTHLYMRAYWKKFRFTYDDVELRVHTGIWWQKQSLIPFTRITNIKIEQGPWQRSRKLATLKIQTAGQGASNIPEAQLWSQEQFEELRDDLLSRISHVHRDISGDGTDEEASSVDSNKDYVPWQKILDVLERIEQNTKSTG